MWFWGKQTEEVSDGMIEFVLDIVNEYQSNKEKYDEKALEEVRDCLDENEKVDEEAILKQLGTPIIDVAAKHGASIMYGSVEEVGGHMPELRLNRDLEVIDAALNG